MTLFNLSEHLANRRRFYYFAPLDSVVCSGEGDYYINPEKIVDGHIDGGLPIKLFVTEKGMKGLPVPNELYALYIRISESDLGKIQHVEDTAGLLPLNRFSEFRLNQGPITDGYVSMQAIHYDPASAWFWMDPKTIVEPYPENEYVVEFVRSGRREVCCYSRDRNFKPVKDMVSEYTSSDIYTFLVKWFIVADE